MNRYGTLAMAHWTRWLPTRVALIPPAEREDFFTQLGVEISDQILATEEAILAAAELSGLEFVQRAGRLTAIHRQAEEMVLAQMVFLDPEPGTDPSDETFQTIPDPDPMDQWMDQDGLPLDRNHPLWAMLMDDSISPEEFAQARRQWVESLPRG